MKPKHTILWADDDVEDREMFREVLEAHSSDHHLVEFPNGMELLAYMEAQQAEDFPCLIVLDFNMPVLGGRETLAKLKADGRFSNIPVAIFTTSNSPADQNFCDRFNVTMFTKPPEYNQLKTAIERLVELCNKSETI